MLFSPKTGQNWERSDWRSELVFWRDQKLGNMMLTQGKGNKYQFTLGNDRYEYKVSSENIK